MYYARYPALSLGHHPPLLAVAEVPAYALFGVSVASARIVIALSLLVATALLYRICDHWFGTSTALVAALVFVTSPYIVLMSHSVLSEMLAVALVVASASFLFRFCERQRRGALVGFALCTVLSLFAKQVAIFVFPAFALTAVAALGVKRLIRRDVIVAAVVVGLLLAPLVVLTIRMSPTNIANTIYTLNEASYRSSDALRTALTEQFSGPVILLIAIGLVRLMVDASRRREWQSLVWVVWAGVVFAGMAVLAPYGPSRFTVYWIPALAVLAARAVTGWRPPALKAAALAVGVIVVAAQARAGLGRPLSGAAGYEAAARFVLASAPGPTVLFSGDVDTGFFTFFVRKHDAERRLVVLRSDKILTTSFLGSLSVEDRIENPQEIYDALQRLGTRYVVIEDRPSDARVLEWLRQELQSARFAPRFSVPIGTSDVRLQETNLVVYEFLDARPPDPEAALSMNLPIVSQSVNVRLSDLIGRKLLR